MATDSGSRNLFSTPGIKSVGTYQQNSGNANMKRNPAVRETRVPNRSNPGGGSSHPTAPSVPLGSSMKSK